MTKKQAADAVKDYMNLCRKSTMTLAVGDDSAQLDMKDCDLTIKNKTKMAEKALAYGSKGSVNQRHKKIQALEKERDSLTGLFAGLKRRKLQSQIDELKDQMRRL